MYQLSIVIKIMFCIFIFFHISNRTDQVKESYGYCTSLSLYLSHSSLSIFIMQERDQNGADGYNIRLDCQLERWWLRRCGEEVVGNARGPNSARAACSWRSERRATRLSGRVRLRNPKRKQSARRKSDAVFIFFFFLKFYSQPWSD